MERPTNNELSCKPNTFLYQQRSSKEPIISNNYEEIRKQCFTDAATQLMHLYKESIKRCEESY